MRYSSILVWIGIAIVIAGLFFAFYSGANVEHAITSANAASVTTTCFKDVAIAVALIGVGSLIVLGTEKFQSSAT